MRLGERQFLAAAKDLFGSGIRVSVMMHMRMTSQRKPSESGERAVDGLLAGVGAGVAMAAFLILVGWMFGEPAGSMLARFSLGGGPLRGALLHLAVSGVYGALFGLAVGLLGVLRDWVRWSLPAMLAGLIYGSFLWLFSGMILLGLQASPFATLPQPAFAVAHLVYGVTLGVLVQRQATTEQSR